jgi:cytochrome P450
MAKEPFLDNFLKKHEQQPDRFTRQHILVGCAANMVAGSDTTAISLAATFYYLLKNPRCYQQLQEEIRLHKPAMTPGQDLTFRETQKMPYLQAVIKEALRMHPATGLPLERVVPQGGMSVCDHYIKAGVRPPALYSCN